MKRHGHAEQGNLFDFLERQREQSQRQWPLDRLKEAVDWEEFRAELEKQLAYSEGKKGGRPPIDPVLMFQICVLQVYHDLSDEEAEWQIRDRASFPLSRASRSMGSENSRRSAPQLQQEARLPISTLFLTPISFR